MNEGEVQPLHFFLSILGLIRTPMLWLEQLRVQPDVDQKAVDYARRDVGPEGWADRRVGVTKHGHPPERQTPFGVPVGYSDGTDDRGYPWLEALSTLSSVPRPALPRDHTPLCAIVSRPAISTYPPAMQTARSSQVEARFPAATLSDVPMDTHIPALFGPFNLVQLESRDSAPRSAPAWLGSLSELPLGKELSFDGSPTALADLDRITLGVVIPAVQRQIPYRRAPIQSLPWCRFE